MFGPGRAPGGAHGIGGSHLRCEWKYWRQLATRGRSEAHQYFSILAEKNDFDAAAHGAFLEPRSSVPREPSDGFVYVRRANPERELV